VFAAAEGRQRTAHVRTLQRGGQHDGEAGSGWDAYAGQRRRDTGEAGVVHG
jgi:hypothetical protein